MRAVILFLLIFGLRASADEAEDSLVEPSITTIPSDSSRAEPELTDAASPKSAHVEASADETTARDHLVVISWALKKGRLDFDRVATVLSEGDLAIVPGEASLVVIAGLMRHRLNENVCVGWFRNAKNVRGPIGVMWRESQLALVDTDGTVRTACAAHPWGLRAHDAQSVGAQFLHRGTGRMIQLNGVTLAHAPKTRDVPGLFHAAENPGWPTLVVGDFKTSPKNTVFTKMREQKFRTVGKAQSDNIWFRGFGLVGAESVRLSARFPEVGASYIKNNLSEASPLRGELSFDGTDGDTDGSPRLLTKRVKAIKPKRKSIAKTTSEAAPAAIEPSALNEDLEAEAAQAVPGDREPDSAPKPKKKKKHVH